MTIAYNYNIKYIGEGYQIFLDEILLATIKKQGKNAWYINIKISGQNFLFTKPAKFNTPVCIHNINAAEKVGTISVPYFPFFFRKAAFFRENKPTIFWCSKIFYSFHWLWKQDGTVLLEAVEDLFGRQSTGIIKTLTYPDDRYLLIIAGIFLSIGRKRRGVLGLFKANPKNYQQKKLTYLRQCSFFERNPLLVPVKGFQQKVQN